MEIRKLDVSEHDRTRKLYEEVFSEDSKAFVDYYYSEKTKDNQIYVVEEDGDIQAMLHLNPYSLMVNGEKKEANYIVAVATRKEYRGRRFMAALIKQVLRDMYESGQIFTYLMPAAEAIYLPHNFRTVCEQNQKFYDPYEKLDDDVMVEKADVSDCEELAECSNRELSVSYQVYAYRTKAYYERLMKEVECESGCLMIYRKDNQIIDCRPYYEEESEDASEGHPKIMVRIVDVRRMLMTMRLKSFIGTCFTITDPIVTENNRTVMITGTEFSGVMLMDEKPEKSEGVITVAALASVLFGAKTPEEISQEEGVRMSESMKHAFSEMIPLRKIYLNEAV